MSSALVAGEAPQLLIFAPAWKLANECSPAALLSISDDGWIVASGTDEDSPAVARASFAGTLLVEMTAVLLRGRMKLTYAAEGGVRSASIDFNTVMEALFDQAARLVLNRMECAPAGHSPEAPSLPEFPAGIPMPFVSAGRRFLPMAQRLLEARHWPAVVETQLRLLPRRRELAQEAMLVLTERELILISDEGIPGWTWFALPRKSGSVVVYCPLARLAGFRIEPREIHATLHVRALGGAAGGDWTAGFPADRSKEVEALMTRALGRSDDLRRRGNAP
jgi:hypothetical protein